MRKTRTNFNLYRSFVEIYETRNLSVAGHNLNVTQPTLTYNVKGLERQLGVRLFNSNARGVEPTPYADEMYPFAREAVIAFANVEEAIKTFNENTSGIIRINLSLYFMSQMTADFIAGFNKKYPHVKFIINSSPINDALTTLKRHEVDFLIMAYNPEQAKNDNFKTVHLREISNSFFASKEFLKSHGLGTKITKSQFDTLPLIALSKAFQARTDLDKIGMASNSIVEVNSTETVISLVEKNIGIAFGPDEIIDKNSNLVKLEITDVKLPKCVLAIKYNEPLANKAAIAFLNGIKK